MKDTEFRGKSLKDGEGWVYGDLRHYVKHADKWTIYDQTTDKETIVDGNTVGQYTGLINADSIGIYEGDIVEVTSTRPQDYGRKMICSIEWDSSHACYVFVAKDRRRVICNTIADCELKTIGNIYDNPELLKNGL